MTRVPEERVRELLVGLCIPGKRLTVQMEGDLVDSLRELLEWRKLRHPYNEDPTSPTLEGFACLDCEYVKESRIHE